MANITPGSTPAMKVQQSPGDAQHHPAQQAHQTERGQGRRAIVQLVEQAPHRLPGSAVEGVNQGLALGAGLLQPFLEQGVAHLLHVGLQRGRGLQDGHAVLLQQVQVLGVLGLGHRQAARLGLGPGLLQRGLGGRVQRIEGGLVDDHRVLRQPELLGP